MSSQKTGLRLAERLTEDGKLSEQGAQDLVHAVSNAKESALEMGCEDLMAFATSAVREASNSLEVLEQVRIETGVPLDALTGEDEARLTFLAARRWYGWSAGELLVLDIGGGSLELATGIDEDPDLAMSLPLGAGRLTRTQLGGDPPSKSEISHAKDWLDAQLAPVAKQFRKHGTPDRVVATSKTFRTLARLTGAAPSSAGPRVQRKLTDSGLRQVIAFITRMPAADLGDLEGVSSSRSHQLVAGALVAEATMRAMSLPEVEICPWALREGVILRRLDHSNGTDQTILAEQSSSESVSQPDDRNAGAPSGTLGSTGRSGEHGARWSR
jgi:exopolyphosphatase/guanosine-5'-triphosphate,3'-diphosphate pyrophosphatase